MKKLSFLIILLIISQCIWAKKSVRYLYKPLAEEGCRMSFNIVSGVDGDSLCVIMEALNFGIIENPEIRIEFFNGDTLTLNGIRKKSSYVYSKAEIAEMAAAGVALGALSGIIIVPSYSSSISIANFPILQEQIELFFYGIKSIFVSSAPVVHKRVFKKDKIGRKLYNLYFTVE